MTMIVVLTTITIDCDNYDIMAIKIITMTIVTIGIVAMTIMTIRIVVMTIMIILIITMAIVIIVTIITGRWKWPQQIERFVGASL